MPSNSEPPDDSRRPGLGAGWFAAATLIGVVVVALVGVLIVIATRDDEDPNLAAAPPAATTTPLPAPTPSTPSSSDNGTDAGRPDGCSTNNDDQTVPVDTPDGVTWTLNKGLALPTSPTDGPLLRGDAGVGYCYSRTPVGAVLAATNLGQGTGTDEELRDAQVQHSIVSGPLTDQYQAEPVVPSDPASSGSVQFRGFRVLSYTDDTASIALAGGDPAQPGGSVVLTLAMQWSEGDWRVVLQPETGAVVTTTTTSSLAGYVPWSGVA